MIRLLSGISFFCLTAMAMGAPLSITDIGKSVVRIQASSQEPNYRQPWTPGRFGGGVGAGFVIEGNRIMTNAHVVSNARFLTVSRQGDPKLYPARVLHVAHDCDLALVTVDDPDFFRNSIPLPIGGLPAMESTVSAFGYPIGGDRMSVTRGVVSRIDFQTYSHSGADAHLTIQIDAAINPGNSGGPVMQDGKVVGVAFQGYSGDVAQNVGYMIPTPVILRFLEDVEDGNYDRYVDLALTYYPLFHPTTRQALGLENEEVGVLVGSVFGQGSADGFLQPGDVLLSIDGRTIYSDGSVELDGENIELAEVVERKFQGDEVEIEFLRNRVKSLTRFPLKNFPYLLQARAYDERPRYLIFAGLVFQPVDRNFMDAFGPDHFRLQYLYRSFLSRHVYRENPELVVLSSLLSDPVNAYADDFLFHIVEEVNGNKIRDLDDLAAAFDEEAEYYVIKFLGEGRPVVIRSEAAAESEERIRERFAVSSFRNLKP
jgi:S1-C subfamily serine protease